MLRITVNDLILFKYLLEEKYIHIDLVKKYIGKNYEASSYRRRLSGLKKSGYIKYVKDFGSHKNFIFPTKKTEIMYEAKKNELKNEVKMRGNTLLKYSEVNNNKILDKYNLSTHHKNIRLTQLRFFLEKIGVDYWRRSSMYYNKYAKNPDAIFELWNKTYAVELELSKKNYKEYKNEFIAYEKVKKIEFDKIIYIPLSENNFDYIFDIIKNKFIYELSDTYWKKRYWMIKFDDLKNNNFMIYYPLEKKRADFNKKMKIHRASKKEAIK
ncbi:MAG: hypothetical protein ACOCP8_09465 [archaeon]